MARLLVLDIDGTLLDPSDIVTPVVRAAIAEARQQGVEVALATGRRLRSTLPIVAELGLRVPLVVYNGALVWSTEQGQPLNEVPLSPEVLAAIRDRAAEVDLAPVLLQGPCHGEQLIIPEPLSEQMREDVARFISGPRLKERVSVPWEALPEQREILTVDLFGREPLLHAATDRLAAQGLAIFHHAPGSWASYWAVNIHMPEVSKAAGVARLARDLGLTMADVVAVGDGENDLPLLEAAGIGVAMGNAPAHVQARADVVVRGHDEDGVAEAIERFVLGGKR